MANGRVVTESQDFIKTFQKLSNRFHTWQVWQDFIVMTACTISNTVDRSEKHLKSRTKMHQEHSSKYTEAELLLFNELFEQMVECLERNPEQDFLGSIYMQLELYSHWKGQFFTPFSLCQLIGELNTESALTQISEKGSVSVSDPACGAGATLIAFANVIQQHFINSKVKLNWQNHVLFVGQDIDTVVALMCYIQLSLLGCAGYIKIGNTLTEPMATHDDMTHYWFTPVYFHEVWHYRRLCNTLDGMLKL